MPPKAAADAPAAKSRKSAAQPAEKDRRSAGSRPAARMESGRSLSLDRCAGIQARSRSRRDRMHRVREGLQGPARRTRRRFACRTIARRTGSALRGDRGSARAAALLCDARLYRQHRRSQHREILRRRAGAHHRDLAASAVLRARTQPHRRCADRAGDGRSRARPLPAVDRGPAQGEALSARGPHRAVVSREVGQRRLPPGIVCSTKPFPVCASR